ncbi:MAG TPA: ABC transporter substrate-binding protein [Roseobacter sp.]|uniref:Uncharacterized protein n=1 Tax=marine sediment metagenome TaxID=412755 RepID=A0A0F9QDQ7_9ZZZZ|nr:ABC transporter substrate-binding protein [Roseobacter sp.]HEC71563.1 ABC transporter substrate-binding protein [Roseobacter sp.]|tara:strand:- start:907 stop:1872 length:966 start_codon:yes stop_codon:yes gene_type:complete
MNYFKELLAIGGLTIALSNSAYGAEHSEDGGNKDYRTFTSDNISYGQIGDSYTADLVMYLAGNQFMVIEDLIKDFQSKNLDIKSIYVETIPPGQIVNGQLLKQGQINGQDTAQNPDLYASVNLGHLQALAAKGKMTEYKVYTHNKLELMVAKGNPKNISGAEDLGRDDLVQSHPNPKTEGIMKFYGVPMLRELGLYDQVTGGQDCKGCWAVEGKVWFTDRHHRETPQRIEDGLADVGIVWTTEVKEAVDEGRDVEGVAIAAPYNKQDEVSYAIGTLVEGRNLENAALFLDFLSSEAAQDIYASYGFVPASAEELTLKQIPE